LRNVIRRYEDIRDLSMWCTLSLLAPNAITAISRGGELFAQRRWMVPSTFLRIYAHVFHNTYSSIYRTSFIFSNLCSTSISRPLLSLIVHLLNNNYVLKFFLSWSESLLNKHPVVYVISEATPFLYSLTPIRISNIAFAILCKFDMTIARTIDLNSHIIQLKPRAVHS